MNTILRIFALSKEEIEAKQADRLILGIARHAEASGGLAKVQGQISFSVSGYDHDPREIWEIPEVRTYFHELDRIAPFFLYYLASEANGPIVRTYLKMFVDSRIFAPEDPPQEMKVSAGMFVGARLEAVFKYCRKVSEAEDCKVEARETAYQTYRCMGLDVDRESVWKRYADARS